MRVEVVLAWARRFEAATLELAEGATVADALASVEFAGSGDVVGHAIHGVQVDAAHPLRDGDRIELLRPLQADPKEARRRRAAGRPQR